MSYTPDIEATLYENWPATIRTMSMPTREHQLSTDDCVALGSVDPAFRAAVSIDTVLPLSGELEAWLDEAVSWRHRGVFMRTSFASFRTSPFSYAPVTSVADAVKLLRGPDARILRHLRRRLEWGGDAYLLAREWRDMDAGAEFRLFVRGGQVVGISTYHDHLPLPRGMADPVTLDRALRQFAAQAIAGLHHDPIALDVFVGAGAGYPPVELVELTPFIEASDAGLFDWSELRTGRGELRYRDQDGAIATIGSRA